MGLKCTVPGCRTTIHAMTGLQELDKLGKHFLRAHRQMLDMNTLLELRVKIENGEPIYVSSEADE